MEKPRTERERKKVQRRLRLKYPQMYEITSADKAILKGLSPGDRKEAERMANKKLKKLYGGK